MLVPVFIMIYFIRNLILHLPIFSTIQKPYYRQSVDFTMAGFADALRPEKFSGVHFKRWQVKVRLWLTVMHAWEARLGIPVGEHSPDETKKFTNANNLFMGYVISVLADRPVDVYMHITYAKELWDALIAMYDATDAGSELYTMESFHDFRMENNRSVVEQAHEIQILMKELELLKYPLPDKFVAGCMIAKLPSSWRNFATALKHKR
jgi:hypothetical protein